MFFFSYCLEQILYVHIHTDGLWFRAGSSESRFMFGNLILIFLFVSFLIIVLLHGDANGEFLFIDRLQGRVINYMTLFWLTHFFNINDILHSIRFQFY